MKPVKLSLFLPVAAGLLALNAVSAPAQNDAGTPPITPNMNAPLPQSLKLTDRAQPATLTMDRPQYRHGQPVRITFRIVNTSGKPVTYNFVSGQRFDITVTNAAGAQVWDWAAGKLFTQNLSFTTLAPGKSLVYKAVWNGRDLSGRPVTSGSYAVSARLTSDNRPAVTSGVVVNTDPDPTNMGVPTRTPAEAGTIRQVAPVSHVSAKTTVVIE